MENLQDLANNSIVNQHLEFHSPPIVSMRSCKAQLQAAEATMLPIEIYCRSISNASTMLSCLCPMQDPKECSVFSSAYPQLLHEPACLVVNRLTKLGGI